MSELIYVRIDEITKDASVPQLKYWSKLLNIKAKVISRVSHVTNEQAESLKKVSELIKNGMRPKEAVQIVSDKAMISSSDKKSEENENFKEELTGLKDAILLLVEQNKKLEEKVDFQNQVIGHQAKEIKSLKLVLTPPKKSVKQIKVWHPKKKKHQNFLSLKDFGMS